MLEVSVPFYPLNAGELVGGKYRISSKLGEGGMGVVFRATHIDLNCDVAIKVIRQELNQQPELIARLMQEARAAAQIRSEHVCRVLDVARLANGSPYVVMEYLQGRNLASVLDSRGRFSEPVAVDYLLQGCEAIAEAHRAGIVHRDLKPENLFLAEFPDGRRAIKVLDFGISKVTTSWENLTGKSLTNPSSAMGSPHYMAPEQMTAASEVDARADIWALGAILHQLLTGQLAFDGDSLPAVCAAVLQSAPIPIREYLPELSPGLEAAISLCMVKDREQRLGSVAELARLIAAFGSSHAEQSAARIRRLLEEEPTTSRDDYANGTLMSPRQLPTPKTPLRTAPIETAAAVTSSRPSIFEGPKTSAGRVSRSRRFGIAALLLLIVGFIAWLGSRGNPEPARIGASQLRSSAKESATPFESPAVASIAQDKALVPSASSTAASLDVTSALPTAAPSAALNANPHPTVLISNPKTHSGAKSNNESERDPYNLDNFGGRR